MELPLLTKAWFWIKKFWVVIVIIIAVLVGIVLLAQGAAGWHRLKRWLYKGIMRWRDVQLEELTLKRDVNKSIVDQNDREVEAIEAQREQVKKKREAAILKAEGMSDEDVVSELHNRGF